MFSTIIRSGIDIALQRTTRSIGATMCVALLCSCASVSMQKVPLISAPQANTALVTFVRTSVFFGDGVSMDIWDGERFVGSLGAGTMIQYETEPGGHLFLANAENWSYTSANLLPGKRYFIRANIFPGVGSARVALAAVPKTDPRIEEWQSKLAPMRALPADKQAVESRKQNEIRAAVAAFKAGQVTFGQLRPEDGL
jgi:hypothetical protein